MFERSETKLLIILTICFITIFSSLCGCIDEKNEELVDEPNYPREYGWFLETTHISGTYSISENLTFEIKNGDRITVSTDISMANPEPFTKGSSTVYAISCNSSPVVEESTGEIVTGASPISEYKNCSIAYIDLTSNSKIDGGDCIYVYCDWDRDGKDEVSSGSIFEIHDKNNEVIFQKELK
jgi:hypothetical protein